MPISIDDTLASALRATGAEAQRRQHSHQTLEHLLFVIVRDGAAANLLEACSCNAAHLRAELAEYLELQPKRSAFRSNVATRDPALERVFSRAGLHALSAGLSKIDIGQVLVQLLREEQSYAAMLLRSEGLDRLALVRYLTHGHPREFTGDPVFLPREQPAAVVLHNDDYTPMDLVVWVLCTIFNHPTAGAAFLMQHIHQHGRAVVGVYPTVIAEDKAAQVRAHAAQAGQPLRCTCEIAEG